jgi:hypothetical protein
MFPLGSAMSESDGQKLSIARLIDALSAHATLGLAQLYDDQRRDQGLRSRSFTSDGCGPCANSMHDTLRLPQAVHICNGHCPVAQDGVSFGRWF